MSQKLCRFYGSRSGCRLGDACRFLHPQEQGTSSTAKVAPPSSQPSSPPGVCRDYWSKGICRNEFKCRFRHVRAGENLPSHSARAPPSRPSAAEAIAPFLTESALARLSGPGTDVVSSSGTRAMSPTEAHNHLKTFLYDNFRFRTTLNVYAMTLVLNSANANNDGWNQEDGQLLLSALAASNGLLRLIDIIRWPQVSMRAGSSREILSFQRGYLPLLRYLSSDFVVKSTLSHLVNGLYSSLIMENFDHFSNVVQTCLDAGIVAKTFKDPSSSLSNQVHGSQVIACLAGVLFEFLTRFKNVVATHSGLRPLVLKLRDWTDAWIQGVSSSPPTFDDSFKDLAPSVRQYMVGHLRTKIDPLISIVDREQAKIDRIARRDRVGTASHSAIGCDEATAAALLNSYEGPGEERAKGRRHDNDFMEIEHIRTVPTHEELTCRIPPFLPANFYGAPHPFPPEGMQRLLDIQFRLLREELMAPLRTSVQLVVDDLQAPGRAKTRLSELVAKKGGKYRSYADQRDSIMFNVYTNATFSSLEPDWRGISVRLSIDAPPGRARSGQAKARTSFWEGVGGKRLMQGGLIGLVWKSGTDITVHLGVIASSTRDLTDSAKQSDSRVTVRIVFFDSDVELRILQSLRNRDADKAGSKILVEASVMFEAIRPFLEALRTEPESIPFGRYLVHRPRGYLEKMRIEPPAYARVPGFSYKLDCLFDEAVGMQGLTLDVKSPESIDAARQQLRSHSRLDPSQATSVVDALTRELVLIQGPPGTGKSYTGVELLRVLLANEVRPILMIAFTNHALDHLLRSVLDNNITSRIVRLGSRSADEKISKFSIEAMEILAGQSRLDRAFAHHHRALKQVQEEIKHLMNRFLQISVDSDNILRFLQVQYPGHHESMLQPPSWISVLHELASADQDGAWQQVGHKGKAEAVDNSLYAYWKNGRDLDFLASVDQKSTNFHIPSHSPNTVSNAGQNNGNMFNLLAPPETDDLAVELTSDDGDDTVTNAPEERWMEYESMTDPHVHHNPLESQEAEPAAESHITPPQTNVLQSSDIQDISGFFAHFGFEDVPPIPATNDALDQLLETDEMWSFSRREREKLHMFWEDQVRVKLYADQIDEFERLRKRHSDVLREYNEGKEEARRNLLQNVDIIGCTTTGAAKLTSLLRGIAPRVMLVEEAGQVLEAHILGSLVPSVEHLILIGDPLQLRPTLNNFALSMDNRRGANLYRFDMSLMERLSTSGLPMSRIDVQRRMRPSIANLIRNTLYPTLEDHELVKSHPDVRGLAKNVYFFSHNHVENGGEDSGSKFNTFEVEMIKDLILYLLRQGCYSNEGDIVVLCAYLGQLAHMRDALSDQVAVVIDERDQQLLADQEPDNEDTADSGVTVEHVKISQRVRLRTIDNFQGEEAKIVILSLVRNSGGSADDDEPVVRANIGFLKSENRTNVALSRAKEGLIIFGNSQNLMSRSGMWRSVISELEKEGSVGDALPVACQRHPEIIKDVSKPGQLRRFAPDGGCLRPCDFKLRCGHVCPYKCHSDDPQHITVTCSQPCRRLCARSHPCNKECALECGHCQFPISNVELPCGHSQVSVPCYLMDKLSEVFCSHMVTKQLPNCEHTAVMKCSQDPASYSCKVNCGGTMSCCGRPCNAHCFQCQQQNTVRHDDEELVQNHVRSKHVQHPCQRTLACEHRCKNACSEDHECTTDCKEPCRQVCVHSRCKNYCSTPCSPCQEPCTWNCPHYTCPVPCGSVCARLPCDKHCERILECGHRCPSVCGEDCSIQICPNCASEDQKARVVDFIMQETLANVNPDLDTLDQMLITIPNCGHVFTVETLDGHCEMNAYYIRERKWLELQAPPPGFLRPPTCPTCRAAITAPRYGRIFKRADLDILEKNIANRMARSLGEVSTTTTSVSKHDLEDEINRASNVTIGQVGFTQSQLKHRNKRRQEILEERRDTPVPGPMLYPGNEELHLVSPAEAKVWRKITRRLMEAYNLAVTVSKTRSAHIHAWEAAFSCLVQHEMDMSITNPTRAPRNPAEYSMRMARMKVGQPKPQADKRFCVEAFWKTINIRFTLAELAQRWLEAVQDRTDYPRQQRQAWGAYAQFLLRTCLQDASIALEIATQSESRRQMTTTSLLIMRANLECFRFNLQMCRQSGTFQNSREELCKSAADKRGEAFQYMRSVVESHLARRDSGANRGETKWLQDNFVQIAKTIIEEWGAVETSIRADTFYQPVSIEEKMSIVQAFNREFSHTGHYYTCPNGHIYVIADCGGASQQAFCPECGAAIGGTNHNLLGTNARATELEELARQAGAQRSPWSWGV